ncbi:MAG: hypothetical protein O7D91_21200 [Planctomycetota bacterium]|nr:hypothetical protein [Planctomycetota bacterium]
MKPNEYLKKILAEQTFDDDDQELKDLRKRRKDIEKTLRAQFSKSGPSIRWGGSMAKGTMIRESYDGDMTCYFEHEEEGAGSTLEEIYNNTEEALQGDYVVKRKASALRVEDSSTTSTKGFAEDLHIDVVPGRYTDDDKDEVFLHRTTGDKERLKTNLQVHIDHIKDSGVTEAIRLMKLWKVRNGLTAKTFVLELLVVKLLKHKKSSGLSTQLEHVWTEFRDKPDGLAVGDPANPSGNDLKPILDECRHQLSSVASNTLWQIENNGWEAVFGELEEDEDNGKKKKAALHATAVHVSESKPTTKPWSPSA